MEMRDHSRLLERTLDFHGHTCPGLLIGYRLALAAAAALGIEPSPANDEELLAVAETDSCGVDAFQAILGTTVGKGSLRFLDYGKHAFRVYDRNQHKAVRVIFTGHGQGQHSKSDPVRRQQFIDFLLNAPQEELAMITFLPYDQLPKARIEESIACARCKELTQASRLSHTPDGPCCRSCLS